MLGFDHVEIGTVTGEPQPGNPKKRLFRLVAGPRADQPHGLQQRGLARPSPPAWPPAAPVFRTIVGVNIGKTKVVPEAEAAADYVKSTERLAAARRLPRRQRLLARTPRACATSRPPSPCARC